MGSPDSVSATMLLNSLIPAVCLLLVSNSHSLGLQGLKEQKAREGKKQVGLPCKTIVTEECSEKEVPRLEEVCDWYSSSARPSTSTSAPSTRPTTSARSVGCSRPFSSRQP